MFALRPYQSDAIAALRANYAAGIRRQVLVAPTGAGKTVMAAALMEKAVETGAPILFLAHRRELIDQPSALLEQMGIPHGIIRANDPRTDRSKPVQVASIQTLIRRHAPDARLVFIDECHRAGATSYQKILTQYPHAAVIGLTATPYRQNGTPLGDIFSRIVATQDYWQLVQDGYLVPMRVFAPSQPDLVGLARKGYDYDPEAAATIMNTRRLLGDTVTHWRQLADDRPTIAFATTVEHSKQLARSFDRAGITATHVDGTTPEHERIQVWDTLASGEIRVVTNVGIATEGVDCPPVSCIILATPTRSLTKYLQCCGRASRPHAESGKRDAIVLDHAGCSIEHGLPQDSREWSLEAKAVKAPSPRVCSYCFKVCPARARTCEHCGREFPIEKVAERKMIRTSSGELVEVTMATMTTKQEKWDELERQRVARGYKRGWSSHQYRNIFGVWPCGVVGRREVG